MRYEDKVVVYGRKKRGIVEQQQCHRYQRTLCRETVQGLRNGEGSLVVGCAKTAGVRAVAGGGGERVGKGEG